MHATQTDSAELAAEKTCLRVKNRFGWDLDSCYHFVFSLYLFTSLRGFVDGLLFTLSIGIESHVKESDSRWNNACQ